MRLNDPSEFEVVVEPEPAQTAPAVKPDEVAQPEAGKGATVTAGEPE